MLQNVIIHSSRLVSINRFQAVYIIFVLSVLFYLQCLLY